MNNLIGRLTGQIGNLNDQETFRGTMAARSPGTRRLESPGVWTRDYVDHHALLIDPRIWNGSGHATCPFLATWRRFDLVISLKVAEHLSFARAESFANDLSQVGRIGWPSLLTDYALSASWSSSHSCSPSCLSKSAILSGSSSRKYRFRVISSD